MSETTDEPQVPASDRLNPRQTAFVREYMVDLNATQAYIRAGYTDDPDAAGANASRLLGDDRIKAAIVSEQERAREKNDITVAKVLNEFWKIASADPNELIESRKSCCRHCWGEYHLYQYTESEQRVRRREFDKQRGQVKGRRSREEEEDMFDCGGGIGFDQTRKPNPDCPECIGEGIMRVVPRDTTELSESARALYAGVRVTKDGFEIKMHDKIAALDRVAKHLGMFIERSAAVNTNGEDVPLPPMVFIGVPAKPRGEDGRE